MGYDGSGNYTRTHNFSADASANIKILAARMDAEFNDFASAMQLARLLGGQNAPTANLPMGGFRHVNVGAPASATNYMRSKEFIENVPIYMVDAEASADRISVSASFYTTASAATAPRDGSHVLIKAGSDKSSAVAIRLNTGDGSPHSANVVLTNSSALYSGAIRSGGIYHFVWSSSDTAWQIMNPQVDYATSTLPGVIRIALDSEVVTGVATDIAVTPAQMAAKFSASYANAASAGVVELATTAEISIGTNISAVITPAVLHSYASAANVTSAGLIEIATTAEVTAGADTARAITPAGLQAFENQYNPYVVIIAINSAGSLSFLSRSTRASAWTASVSTGVAVVTHNIGLASANAMTINIQVAKHDETRTFGVALASTGVSAFKFVAFETGSASGNITSANYHIVTHRIV